MILTHYEYQTKKKFYICIFLLNYVLVFYRALFYSFFTNNQSRNCTVESRNIRDFIKELTVNATRTKGSHFMGRLSSVYNDYIFIYLDSNFYCM